MASILSRGRLVLTGLRWLMPLIKRTLHTRRSSRELFSHVYSSCSICAFPVNFSLLSYPVGYIMFFDDSFLPPELGQLVWNIMEMLLLCWNWKLFSHGSRLLYNIPCCDHYSGVMMGAMASQITSITTVYSKAQIKENIKAPRHWPLCGNSPVNGEFPAQMASYVKKSLHSMPSSW